MTSGLLPHSVDRAAARFGERDAFRCQGRVHTYADLCERANQLAHLLIDQGVAHRDRVGVYLPRCLESAVAVYGIMKAGAAYVPIDPHTSLAGLQHLIDDCGIRHLISGDTLGSTLTGLLVEPTGLECVVGVRGGFTGSIRAIPWHALAAFPGGSPPDVRTTQHDLAYIMYTSGSTGRPKGIMHTHFSGLSYAQLSVDTYGVTPDDRIGSHSPLHFDMSTFGYFSGPLAGATTVLIPEAHTKLPASLSQLMEVERLTIWYSVPFALIQLLLRGVLDTRDLRSLRWVLFGGEPFPPKHLRALMRQWPRAWFSNVYGPAEVNQCTYFHVPPVSEIEPSDDDTPIPIGRTWDDTEALVLDIEDRPVAPGQAGELVISSPTMMRGYWAQPRLNATAFYRQRDQPDVEKVYYRTGDRVLARQDGQYLFLGRMDRQIKIRGYRVELDDIELALSSHPHIDEAAAFRVTANDDAARIAAAVIVKPDTTVTPDEIIAFAAKRLPWYSVPADVTIHSSLPRTTSGKIDRLQLQRSAEAP